LIESVQLNTRYNWNTEQNPNRKEKLKIREE